jgi:hypothetical protein
MICNKKEEVILCTIVVGGGSKCIKEVSYYYGLMAPVPKFEWKFGQEKNNGGSLDKRR